MKVKLIISIFLTISLVEGSKVCYKCSGIQCSRTTYNLTKTCEDSLDICVTIFENFNVIESGCSEEIPSNLMKKCSPHEDDDDDDENYENSDCFKCNDNLCNNKGQYKCSQCDSKMNSDCKNNTSKIMATNCPISTSENPYCFTENRADETVVRGCSGNLKHQRDCLNNNNCTLCLASDIENCNGGEFKSDNKPPPEEPKEPNLAIAINFTISSLILSVIWSCIY